MRHFQGGFQPESDFGISNWTRNLESDQVRFSSQNGVKSGQNRPKLKDSENWEKMQFFHVSITIVALELVAPAQIEKKSIFLDPAYAFPTRNCVKSSQNRPKCKNSENWEKIQFFHVSITFVAQKLVSPAQI